mmetsp:Transcript_29402/g.68872  ORF Transcript_29402/g.68872 Transcript_29402/m.68872 type:complete len:237 (+) Transcript_29402:527-1237(+)
MKAMILLPVARMTLLLAVMRTTMRTMQKRPKSSTVTTAGILLPLRMEMAPQNPPRVWPKSCRRKFNQNEAVRQTCAPPEWNITTVAIFPRRPKCFSRPPTSLKPRFRFSKSCQKKSRSRRSWPRWWRRRRPVGCTRPCVFSRSKSMRKAFEAARPCSTMASRSSPGTTMRLMLMLVQLALMKMRRARSEQPSSASRRREEPASPRLLEAATDRGYRPPPGPGRTTAGPRQGWPCKI